MLTHGWPHSQDAGEKNNTKGRRVLDLSPAAERKHRAGSSPQHHLTSIKDWAELSHSWHQRGNLQQEKQNAQGAEISCTVFLSSRSQADVWTPTVHGSPARSSVPKCPSSLILLHESGAESSRIPGEPNELLLVWRREAALLKCNQLLLLACSRVWCFANQAAASRQVSWLRVPTYQGSCPCSIQRLMWPQKNSGATSQDRC